MLNCSRGNFVEAISGSPKVIVLGTIPYNWSVHSISMQDYVQSVLKGVNENPNFTDSVIKSVVPVHISESDSYSKAVSIEKWGTNKFKGVKFNYADKVSYTVEDACISFQIGKTTFKRCVAATSYHRRDNLYRTSYGMFGNFKIGSDYYAIFGEILEIEEPHFSSTAYFSKMVILYAIKLKDNVPYLLKNKSSALFFLESDDITKKKKQVKSRKESGGSTRKRSSKSQFDAEYEAQYASYYDEPEIIECDDDEDSYL